MFVLNKTQDKKVFLYHLNANLLNTQNPFIPSWQKSLSNSPNHVDPNKIVSCLKQNWQAFFVQKYINFYQEAHNLDVSYSLKYELVDHS